MTGIALANFDLDHFMAEIWQQRPMLIKGAFPEFKNPLSSDELAGLSLEEDVESRLVIGSNRNFILREGPFCDQDFAKLAPKDWTLLVQAVDHYVPAVAELLEPFRFIPNWRIDDVMVSYAVTGGSVGPHYDNYDVFLIQGLGHRQWQLGQLCADEAALVENSPLRLLENFEPEQEWLLEAGDVLYLPPRYAHWGIATDDQCMTYSVGFRAPSYREVLHCITDRLFDKLGENERYTDARSKPSSQPGEISHQVLQNLQLFLTQQLQDTAALATWFGEMVTEPKYNREPLADPAELIRADELQELLADIDEVERDPASRFSYYLLNNNNELKLFVNSHSYLCQGHLSTLARLLADHSRYDADLLLSFMQDQAAAELLTTLFNHGCFYWDDGSD